VRPDLFARLRRAGFYESKMPNNPSDFSELRASLALPAIGEEIQALIQELYPICRSITGDGFRQTLARIQKEIPLEVREVASGTQVFDWTVPREWNIRDAYIKNSNGERVIDFLRHNLHVVNYSVPVHRKMSLAELRPHLHSLPQQPDLIPYRTSYYKENWGFCLPHRQLEQMLEDNYEVRIDSTLQNGHLTYGEYLLKGASQEEVLISCHSCHPSLCNDNLSGVTVATFLARHLARVPLHYSYRFLFIPGTIGSITWLSLNQKRTAKIRHGLVLTCVGDSGSIHYKKSRRGNAVIDRAVIQVLKHSGAAYEIQDFSPYGYDERQYCSPGFDLPVGCFMRTPHGKFPEYHSSADNLDFMKPASLADSFSKCLAAFYVLENDDTYLNLNPHCEPQLGSRGLYRTMGGHQDEKLQETAMLWVLNQCDGTHSLLEIAERSGLPFDVIKDAADNLLRHDLLKLYKGTPTPELHPA
jgi:aminopeptidase-like protein